MVDLKKLVGKKIQHIRKQKGMTQEKLAEMIGIEVPSLSNIETGKFAPSIETLQKLSSVLGMKPWEFYYVEELSEESMKQEIVKALDSNQKLLKPLYYFYKSLEY